MFWMSVLIDLRNRGVRDTFFVVCDGLKGLPEWSATCGRRRSRRPRIIHVLGNTFRLTSRQVVGRGQA